MQFRSERYVLAFSAHSRLFCEYQHVVLMALFGLGIGLVAVDDYMVVNVAAMARRPHSAIPRPPPPPRFCSAKALNRYRHQLILDIRHINIVAIMKSLDRTLFLAKTAFYDYIYMYVIFVDDVY